MIGISKRGKAIVIMGPTSSGKTELSLRLAKKFNGVVISADSRQLYKGMDIATAKTTRDQQQGIPHYMIDIIDPDEDFSLASYQSTVNNLLQSIAQANLKRKKPIIPFIVGGTGLYIKSIVDGYQLPAVPPNKKLRQELENKSLDQLVKELKKLAPKTKVDLKNKRRIIRAIEIIKTKKIGWVAAAQKPAYDFLQIGITRPREELNRRIEEKVDQMYKTGLVKETKKLLAKGYNFNLPAFSAHGYKHIKKYLEHKSTLREALELMKKDTRNYAKRQMTWFKADKRVHWVTDYTEAEASINNFLN